ncbi:MAG: hypothetical protein RLW68_02010, partial [Devosia marina]|uniref:hypothetical protein n=1 Tax=Devosia marina TaxID=2683198 RepID=UPI0032F0388C
MPQYRNTVGTGITEHAVVTFDHDDRDDVEAMVEAASFTLDRTNFQRLSSRISNLAGTILDAVGLPTNVHGHYLLPETDGQAEATAKTAADNALTFPAMLAALDVPRDSPEGYAARALMQIDEINNALTASDVDEALAMAFALGELVNEAAMKAVWEPDALRGEKVLASARDGHAMVHGNEEEKAARRATHVQAFEEEIAKGVPRMVAYENVARGFKVGVRSVQRAVSLASK